MNYIKCPKCGREEPSFDYAHICGPVKVKSKMNERIEHLLYLSGLTAQGCWDELDEYARQGIEKFAELIVQECSNWLKQPVNQTPSCGVTMNIAADRLKEHFGVEE
jgi:hypothetical protein